MNDRSIPVEELEGFLKKMHARFLGTMNAVGKRHPNSSIVSSCDGGRGAIEALAKEFRLDIHVDPSDHVNVYEERR